ncbi:sigma-70 family RNA polymerase sigma factor [Thermanaeromonas sp. C210]|uniref:sigma-70 family RNA polymerase sigma factor n=1 Tax=Thermanaeromonas sp. C210 TaxID=2731925 RepID=UPI0020B6389C|nr:sigma-70 family RNA polymerase sigma factor [Thermanaeromonas sp. C210]
MAAWLLTGLCHEATRLARKQKYLRKHELLILNKPVNQESEEEEREMVDALASPADTLAEVEDTLFLEEALSVLTPQQQRVIIATVLNGATEYEVAKKLGISQPAVHRIKVRALNRLRKHLVPDGPDQPVGT